MLNLKMSLKNLYSQICLLALLIAFLFTFASAQLTPDTSLNIFPDTSPDISPDISPGKVADEAVKAWQSKGKNFELTQLLQNLPAEPQELCKELTSLGPFPNLIKEIEINFEDRLLIEETETAQVYAYATKVTDSVLGQVKVKLIRQASTADQWEAESVKLNLSNSNPSPLSNFNYPVAGWLFLLFSASLVYLCLRPSFFRDWLLRGVNVLREHRRITLGTIIFFYFTFGLGLITGKNTPPECHAYLVEVINTGISDIGIVEILESKDVARLAAAISFWNFSMGAITTTFLPASFFALPAYLLNFFRFFYLAIPFANAPPLAMFLHLPVIIVELLAYILVTTGGGMFLATLIRQGWKAYREGLEKLFLMIPIALVLLVIAAWYESFELLLLLAGSK